MKARSFSPTKISHRAVKFRAGTKSLQITYCLDCGFQLTFGTSCIRCSWAERSSKS